MFADNFMYFIMQTLKMQDLIEGSHVPSILHNRSLFVAQ
jgi:hypothetical protein